MDSKNKQDSESDPNAIAKIVIWVFAVIVVMIIFAAIEWPSGNKMGVTDFVIFWLRELLIIGALLILFIIHLFSGKKSTEEKEKH